jgi:RNA-directed DNA polymerase
MAFTTLAHRIDVDLRREAYRRTRKDGAPGIDGVTAQADAEHLEANLANWYAWLRRGQYRAPPVRRTDLDKEDGGQRPIGIPAFEDNMVQRAVVLRLGAIDEQDCWDGSDGVRQGRSPHQARQEWREQCRAGDIGWIVDAEVSACFDRVDHDLVRERLRPRVADGTSLGLIGKWLTAGVVEGDTLSDPARGSPQGGVRTLPTKLQKG